MQPGQIQKARTVGTGGRGITSSYNASTTFLGSKPFFPSSLCDPSILRYSCSPFLKEFDAPHRWQYKVQVTLGRLGTSPQVFASQQSACEWSATVRCLCLLVYSRYTLVWVWCPTRKVCFRAGNWILSLAGFPTLATMLMGWYLLKEYKASLASRSSSGGEIGKCEWYAFI